MKILTLPILVFFTIIASNLWAGGAVQAVVPDAPILINDSTVPNSSNNTPITTKSVVTKPVVKKLVITKPVVKKLVITKPVVKKPAIVKKSVIKKIKPVVPTKKIIRPPSVIIKYHPKPVNKGVYDYRKYPVLDSISNPVISPRWVSEHK